MWLNLMLSPLSMLLSFSCVRDQLSALFGLWVAGALTNGTGSLCVRFLHPAVLLILVVLQNTRLGTLCGLRSGEQEDV